MEDKERIILNEDFFEIAGTDSLVLGCCWESIYLIDKIDYNEIHLGNLDGMVNIGIISEDNSWAITGREVIILWYKGNVITIDKAELKCVEEINIIAANKVVLTIDKLNLNNNRSMWVLDVMTLELEKLA